MNGLSADLRVPVHDHLANGADRKHLFAALGIDNRQRISSPPNARAVGCDMHGLAFAILWKQAQRFLRLMLRQPPLFGQTDRG
jgi:hypothetical protein